MGCSNPHPHCQVCSAKLLNVPNQLTGKSDAMLHALTDP